MTHKWFSVSDLFSFDGSLLKTKNYCVVEMHFWHVCFAYRGRTWQQDNILINLLI